MFRRTTDIAGTLAWLVMAVSFLGATFSIPYEEILQREEIIPDHCTCMMDGGHCNCPYCIVHHITDMKGCRDMCCCGYSRPAAQEPRPATDAIALLFTHPIQEIPSYRTILLRNLPGFSAALPDGAIRRLIKPPRASSTLI